MTGLGPGEGTWTCHICKRERPDALISVQKNTRQDPVLGTFTENVRYCNDTPACAEAAKTFSFLPADG